MIKYDCTKPWSTIEYYLTLYEKRFGVPVCALRCHNLNQSQLLDALKRAASTGESILVSYGKLSKRRRILNEQGLYGFRLRIPELADDVAECEAIFNDANFLYVINQIESVYAKIFVWFSFIRAEDLVRASLQFDDKRSPNSALEVEFSIRDGIWKFGDGHNKHISLLAAKKFDMDEPDSLTFVMDWEVLDNILEYIVNDITIISETYLKGDFTITSIEQIKNRLSGIGVIMGG